MSTLNLQSVYITSAPGLVNLKIGISNLAGVSHFFTLLPLQPLHLCWQPAVSLAVEYPSESGAPLSGQEGGEPPSPTTVHWDLDGHPHGHASPVWEVSLVLACPSTVLALSLAEVHFQPVAPRSQTPLHSQLEYYGLGSQPGCSAFSGWRQQPLTAMPPSEEEANGKVGRA